MHYLIYIVVSYDYDIGRIEKTIINNDTLRLNLELHFPNKFDISLL